MRRAARVDQNQDQIVSALRAAGAVVQSLASQGRGCADLVCGFRDAVYLFEVKDGNKVPSAQKLTPAQEKWHKEWAGYVRVVNSPEAALRAIGILKEKT
jgi:hypothetical protein